MLRIMAQPEMETCGVFRNGPTQQYSVYSQKKHRAVPYLQFTFVFSELKCDINQTLESIFIFFACSLLPIGKQSRFNLLLTVPD